MKRKILVAFVILGMISCQNKVKTEKENVVEAVANDTLTKTATGSADVSDAPVKDDKAVELIRKQLLVLLKADLPALTKDDRYFYYSAFDLNNDKKDEYFVGFSNPYFCGSGGCSGYILNNDGSLINKFTVTDFPIYVTTSVSEKFYDLIAVSGGKFHLLKLKNGKYPSNPSVQEVVKEDASRESTKVLDIDGKKLEKYSF
ncbi:hypothetical protein [Flavobacterium hibernum]|uniref:Lipoprotein n=1 Tax=Flavobacterium hibernum TaxID=37752 RepID=A0A0D0EZJ9_9FLAO|nr:hypothetical protein [Flavobacterium hibernum]KIO52811.1 hypothetical protein IW18_09720 [Flavobacterium hibernum]OXA84332.1 hypothetical protein B0A73_20250 [Flavobacterium hibernum]STO15425.1 Predicted membrane protein [Flavobacterium hibernum]